MWFCCQIWQCSVKSCFSPSFDMQWKGWTHVVYPSNTSNKSNPSLTFLETRLVDDHVKTNIFLHRQKSFQNNDSSPITCFVEPTSEAVECEVAVEIHPGPSIKTTTTTKSGPPPLLRHASVTSLCSNKGWENAEEGEAEQRGSWRASSTDWTKLETSLDYWRQEHFKAQKEDHTNSSKVRYNDTGSLEEVSVDNCVDYFVEDEIMVHLEAEREHMRQQYRRLWQLRATLEEDEKPNVKQHTQTAATQPSTPAPGPSSPDQSPEAEALASHTTSFESNTEPLLEEGSARLPPHLLQLPSYETRRQNYRNILNWRLRKMEARNARRHCGRQTSLEDTSFDSMDTVDTVDTEESSTDASRIDQATTSFESTTDNTDSPSEQQVHRLQHLRADSGYRSLENPAPNTLKLLYPQQHVTSSEDPHALSHRIPSLGDSFENVSEAEEGISVIDIDIEGCSSQHTTEEVDEGVGGLGSPPTSIYESPPWEGRRKPGGQPTSKKRRDLSGSTCPPSVTSTATVRTEYTRDYSVDEKSDALFREFSRCDLDSKRQHRLTAYRRLLGPYPYPKLSEPPSDDVTLASVPIIRVADEESSDQV
ncbi:uncharacterized protein LOC128998590 isoform X2 [Macrosteles quadrilineatus]|uniref:uncharacterized protein LOC128998590 isoform X2 n=1 Tax=Macrosteles quadrilineatus TaxID=74068 RepID=UPI0023E0CE61|nr:uncharacterized protein LOC128998590 isoform X2 [Macrosteles quadrilineatus]